MLRPPRLRAAARQAMRDERKTVIRYGRPTRGDGGSTRREVFAYRERKYFKHCLQAPGLYAGYAPKTLPGVYDAVCARRRQEDR